MRSSGITTSLAKPKTHDDGVPLAKIKGTLFCEAQIWEITSAAVLQGRTLELVRSLYYLIIKTSSYWKAIFFHYFASMPKSINTTP